MLCLVFSLGDDPSMFDHIDACIDLGEFTVI